MNETSLDFVALRASSTLKNGKNVLRWGYFTVVLLLPAVNVYSKTTKIEILKNLYFVKNTLSHK